MRTLSKRLFRVTRDSQNATDQLAYVVEENVLAHRDIRLHAAQPSQAIRFFQLGESLRRLSMKSTAASGRHDTADPTLLAAVALSAVLTVALVQSADRATSIGSFVAFVTTMLMLIAPLKQLSEVANTLTRGLAAMERGLDLMSLTPDETGGNFAVARAGGDIHFELASVTYGSGPAPALDSVTLDVQGG